MIEENIIKNVIIILDKKKEINDNIIKNIRNLFSFKKKIKQLKLEQLEIL